MSSGSRTTGYLYLQGNPQPITLYDKFQFGRMESFDNPAVSRTHFTVAANDSGAYFIIDHESRSGTSVDGKKINPGQWYELQEGTKVTVGPYIFEFSFKPAHKRPPVAGAEKRKSGSKRDPSSRKNNDPQTPEQRLELQKGDTTNLHLDKFPRVASPAPKRPVRVPTEKKMETDADYSDRLRLFLMICAVITVATLLIVQNRSQTSREQMFPYYASYMNIMKSYYKNYEQFQRKRKDISTFERDQNALVKGLREMEQDLRVERPVDRKADYYKKHMLFLIGKTQSHSANILKYFRTGKFNYFTLAKQDDADMGQEMTLLTSQFGSGKGVDAKGSDGQRVPAAVSQGSSDASGKSQKKVRGKKSRTPF